MHAPLVTLEARYSARPLVSSSRCRAVVAQAAREVRKPRGQDPLAGVEWWKDDPQPSTSSPDATSLPGTQPQRRPQQQQQQQQRFGKDAGRRGKQGSRADEEDDDDDEVGWWQRPRPSPGSSSSSSSSGAASSSGGLVLEPWQEERLKVTYAVGRRNFKVQDLAADLGLDRNEVLIWMKQFGRLSEADRAAALAPLAPAIQEAQQQSAAAKAAAQAAQRREQEEAAAAALASGASSSSSSSSSSPGPQGAPAPPAPTFTFNRRLTGEAQRSLAGVYARSPWPPREVVAGLWELHRLPRDTVLDWFRVQRAADGLPDNPRDMRAAREAASAAAAAAGGPSWLEPERLDALVAAAAAQQGLAGGGGQQGRAATRQAAVEQVLSGRELMALRSALPSPRTHKGARLQEQLGIKGAGAAAQGQGLDSSSGGPGTAAGSSSSASTTSLQIAGITFVVRDARAAWATKWRRYRLSHGAPGQRLDFQRPPRKVQGPPVQAAED